MSSYILHLFHSEKHKIFINIYLLFSRLYEAIGLGNGISTENFHVEISINSFAFLLKQDNP